MSFHTILGKVSSTSKKQGDFPNGLMSVYIDFANEQQKERAKAIGLPVYTSKDGDTFTIVQTSRKGVRHYDKQGIQRELLPGECYDQNGQEIEGVNNWSTGGLCALKLSTGTNKGNKYWRLYAVIGSTIEKLEGDVLEGLSDEDLAMIDDSEELPF